MSEKTNELKPRKLWNPYVAGFSLGLVLLAAFVIIGQGWELLAELVA